MMKRILFLTLLVVAVSFSGCSENDEDKENYIVALEDEQNTGQEKEPLKDGTVETIVPECYVESFECGYVSHADNMRWQLLLISTEEELKKAESEYCLVILDEWWANNSIAEAFQNLKSTYPLEEYDYLIEYSETSCGGYYFHADKVLISEDKIGFYLDEHYGPEPGEAVADVMGGFCHMAAIPKSELEGKTFTNVN